MEKLRSFGVNSDMLVTFYNALICSFIMFGSLCWGGNSFKFDNWRLEKVVKKEKRRRKKQVMFWESHGAVLRLYMKRNYRNLMQILNDNTRPMRQYLIADAVTVPPLLA